MSSTPFNHQHCPHTFHIFMVNDQLQLCIYPCSDDVQMPWQQCWYRLPIQIIYPKDVLSHAQITSNHMWWDLGSKEDVPTPPSPTFAPYFAHHVGNEALHCPGAKWHNAQAVLVVYPSLQDCAVILAIEGFTNWHGMVKYNSTLAQEHDIHDLQSTLTGLCCFLPWWYLGMPFNILSFQLRISWMHTWLINH